MRKLLPALTDDQLVRLCDERSLTVPTSECTSTQKAVLQQVAEELVAYQVRRWPEDADVQAALARYGLPAKDPNLYFNVCLRGEAAQYTIEVRVGASQLGQFGEVGRGLATRALSPEEPGRPAPLTARGASEPIFALPARSSWSGTRAAGVGGGDVLADIAARAKVNLIADDYTRSWSRLARYRTPQLLSEWLAAICEEYEFEPAGDGPLLRLRHHAWWRERQREIPVRLLTRMDPAHLQLFGTEATTRELRDWWKERKLATPPRALLPETARQLGARHQPLAIVLDSEGRVTWVKQGYVPGDEVEWGRQLARVGARSAEGHTRAGWTRRRAGSITSRANGTRPSPG